MKDGQNCEIRVAIISYSVKETGFHRNQTYDFHLQTHRWVTQQGLTLVTDTDMSLNTNHWRKPPRSCYWSSVHVHPSSLMILTSLALVQRTVYYNVGCLSSQYWCLERSSRHTQMGESCLANCLRWSVAGEMRWAQTSVNEGGTLTTTQWSTESPHWPIVI